MTQNTNLGIFSFFSGCGLLDLGFEKAGFHTRFVNEYYEPFLDGYRYSRKKLGVPEPKYGYSSASIVDVASSEMKAKVDFAKNDGDLIGFIGGPPCPDFSVGGKNRGQEGDNGKLSRVYIDLVCAARPDFFVFENVKGLWRTKKHRAFYESLKVDLVKAGYHLHERLINAIEFGAPQDRDRIILMGFHNSKFSGCDLTWDGVIYPERAAFSYEWPDTHPFNENGSVPKPNNVPLELTVQHWFDKNAVNEHPNARHVFQPRAGLKRFLTLDEGDDSKKSYKRLHRWRYSPTAAYGNNEVHVHPYKARRISVAEALAIQSAPRDFELPASMTLSAMFKTVGNGVPFLAAQGIALTVKRHIKAARM
ncbi:DNA cytosine methyltransferase [Xinfangfangia sp. D13-10-4-6]|uniref:DNA cytosine methyltransferase n=1 Tax=Pseudogemmobacter hezensis TaxID=2737662 RepID=UPI00155417FD|nr:DNA cytosine methyltransferase [Pseudogemmobacter hezensis]NPD17308.1 DNA cytosine methyltransferase [Pseudogemmobacter hezensis]